MAYARWASKQEADYISTLVSPKEKLERSGIQIGFEKENLRILNNTGHTLVIGSIGSGKTQSTVLPLINTSAKAGESFVVTDPKGELYKMTATMLEKKGYQVNYINLYRPKFGDCFNPLTVPYNLYNEGEKDKAMEMVENLGYYLVYDSKESGDPFWTNTTVNFFAGIVLYMFESLKEEDITLSKISEIANALNGKKESDEFLKPLKKESIIYKYVAGTLSAPPETRESIFSVFNMKLNKYISKEKLTEVLSSSTFNLKDIIDKKEALFIIGGTSDVTDSLTPLIVDQIYTLVDLYNEARKKINVILDEFDLINPIKNFNKIIMNSRSIGLTFTVLITSFATFTKVYGKEEAEIIKFYFQNMIYLLSSDVKTIDEIVKLCGNGKEGKPLIGPDELKRLDFFEAIVLVTRIMPIRTTLQPNYKIDWGYVVEEKEMKERI